MSSISSGRIEQDFSFLVGSSVFGDLHLSRVLEVGCGGRGDLARHLATVYDAVVAIDSDLDCVRMTESALTGLENVQVLQTDARATEFESSSFDAIVACRTLHFVCGVQSFLQEVDRLLKPGGRLIVLNYPLFEVKTAGGNGATMDRQLEGVVSAFCGEAFKEELSAYWSDQVAENFCRFSDPDRRTGRPLLPGYSSEVFSVTIKKVRNVLDLPALLLDSAVCRQFVNKHGEEEFKVRVWDLQRKILLILKREVEDVYFEEIDVMICTDFYIETSIKPH